MSRLKVLCAALALITGLGVQAGIAQATSSQNESSQAASWKLASTDGTTPAIPSSGSSSSLNDPDAAPASAAVVAVPPPLPAKKTTQDSGRLLPFSRVAIGTRTGTLGLGGQIATPLTRWLNLRGGADLFNFHYGLTNSGTNYDGELHLKSGLVSLDVFPFHHSGFHISPGMLIFKSSIAASLNVPGGNTFSMGNSSFTSSPSDPVKGTGSILFSRSIMPVLTFGFGNMIARESKHWSVPVEIGAAYTGHYTTQINLTGTACSQGSCVPTSDPSIQTSVTQEQNDLNEQTKHFQIYPILTTGISYRF